MTSQEKENAPAGGGKRLQKPVRIVLVDDHRLVREGLRYLLSKESDFEVVGDAENGRSALRVIERLTPDVVVMDITMPDLNGIEATRRIAASFPDVKVVGLSIHTDSHFVAEMLNAGARGYLPKDSSFKELFRAVRTVSEGHRYISPSVTTMVIEDYLRENAANGGSPFTILSEREREILQLIAEGETAKDIATKLNITFQTVNSHRANIMTKLGVDSIAELTKFAVREGLTSLEP